jgi:serine/threonine protein kinase
LSEFVSSNVLACPACGEAVDITDLEIGTTITCPHCGHEFTTWRDFSNYRLTRKVGEGGMGSVFESTDLNLDRTVAIKVLKPELSEDKKFIKNFLTEVEVTAQLTHPNIVQVYSFGQHEGQYYLVMEFISAETLDDKIIEQERLGEIEVLDCAIGISNGLNFALQQGDLVHRDIKPGNILFSANNTPKVVDFGLAITPETADSGDGEIWGTPYYVSPERLEQVPEDFRSDMYSLGVSLYHALAGRPPFDANTAELVAAKHLSEKPLPLKTLAPQISDHTAYAIMKAMSRNPDERFSTYEDFIEQLEDAKRRLQETATSGAEPVSYTVVEADVKDKKVLASIGLVVGLIFLSIGLYLVLALA